MSRQPEIDRRGHVLVPCSTADCHESVDTESRYVLQRLKDGWIHPRAEGGPNAVHGRVMLDEWACRRCTEDIKAGVPPGTWMTRLL